MFEFDFYLAGPMRGIKDENTPMFNKVATMLREYGYTVFNPAEANDGDLSFEECMTVDLDAVVNKGANVAILPGWRKSLGSNVEVFSAYVCGKAVYEVDIETNPGFIMFLQVQTDKYDLPYGRACLE